MFGKLAIVLLATISPLAAADPKPADILKDMKRVADWQIANPSKHPVHDWTQAPFFLGLSVIHQVSGDAKYLEALDSFGKQLAYGPGPRVTHADDHAVLQAWLEMYRLDKDKAKMAPSVAHFHKVMAALANETPKSVSGGSFTWCWCDALFMSPAVWAHLSKITGEPKFFEWADRQLHNSDTFIAHRVIENTPERVAFELDYASDLNGRVLRETKRITLIMGQRLFQSDSRFTLDGKPAANLEVAIGLAPQVKDSTPAFSPKTGAMMIWEKFDGYGLGTGVVIDPARVVKMIPHTDAAGQTQALCLARTDADGAIRWFSGFGWEGQGDITTAEKWTAYLKSFAAKFVPSLPATGQDCGKITSRNHLFADRGAETARGDCLRFSYQSQGHRTA